jgi:exopolysaccharide biosynthesis polyprenyl glycosylphosphotransferase
MNKLRHRTLVQTGMCADLAICAVSLLLATDVMERGVWEHGTLLLRDPVRQILATIILSLCWHVSLVLTGAYQSYRGVSIKDQAAALVNGATVATLWVAVWLFASKGPSRVTIGSLAVQLGLFWILTTCGFLVTRLAGRLWMLAFRRRGRNLRSVLIVGSNQRAVALAERFSADPDLAYQLVGFVDDYWHFEHAPARYKRLLLGDLSSFLDMLRSTAIDEVVIALPIASNYRLIEQIIDWCSQQGIGVAFEASLFDNSRTPVPGDERLHGMMTLYDATPVQWTAGAKRLIDIAVSGCALLLLSPILAATAIGIKLTSPGPVFFLQERLGLGKRRFKIFKFRTMVVNAESILKNLEHLNQSGGPTFKLDRDPRVTPFGAFLRRTSLDELPQLLNVFFGDMSLVGPRPLPLRDYQGFSQDWHRRRFSVRPGITCIWQVNGRSSITFDKWMELDMDYIDRWSLWLDLTILVRTIPAVIRGSGAM